MPTNDEVVKIIFSKIVSLSENGKRSVGATLNFDIETMKILAQELSDQLKEKNPNFEFCHSRGEKEVEFKWISWGEKIKTGKIVADMLNVYMLNASIYCVEKWSVI